MEIIANDDAEITLADARSAWEAGEFSDWVEQHGFPIEIEGISYSNWDGVEVALAE